MKLRAGCSRDHLKITILKCGSDVSLTLTIYSQREKAESENKGNEGGHIWVRNVCPCEGWGWLQEENTRK